MIRKKVEEEVLKHVILQRTYHESREGGKYQEDAGIDGLQE